MKILMVLPLPAVRTLGGARIQVELADAMRALGHEVDFLAGPDVYKRDPNRLTAFLRVFSIAARSEIRRRASNYDVIDALEGSVTVSKRALCFEGALIARSIGLRAAYERWRVTAERDIPELRGRPIGRIPRKLKRRLALWEGERCRRHADGFFVPNRAEEQEVAASIGPTRVRRLPFGLSESHRTALSHAADQSDPRAPLHIVFIGTWDARKGCHDLPLIIRQLYETYRDMRVSLLGTGDAARGVAPLLGTEIASRVTVVPHFTPAQLPELLAAPTIGVFPSYVEGLPFAILEQLAAGIPVVAYDVPGPRDILKPLDGQLLVRPGDAAALARTVIDVNESGIDPARYVTYAAPFRWEDIAVRTVDAYNDWTELAGKET